MSKPEIKSFNWCGYDWETSMESGRLINTSDPRYYVDGSQVEVDQLTNVVKLSMAHKPTVINWFGPNWSTPMTYYTPTIACGLIKSKQTFKVNSKFECDVKLPKGSNLWFSFWLTGSDNWPPEIDVFEGYTDEYDSYKDKLGLHLDYPFIYKSVRLESNVHYKDKQGIHRQIGPKGVNQRVFSVSDVNYLSYVWTRITCIWKTDYIKLYVNNKLVRMINNKKVLSRLDTSRMWAIFNLWPDTNFDININGDIRNFKSDFELNNFKVTSI